MEELEIPKLTPEQEAEGKSNMHADLSYKMKNKNPKPIQQQANA